MCDFSLLQPIRTCLVVLKFELDLAQTHLNRKYQKHTDWHSFLHSRSPSPQEVSMSSLDVCEWVCCLVGIVFSSVCFCWQVRARAVGIRRTEPECLAGCSPGGQSGYWRDEQLGADPPPTHPCVFLLLIAHFFLGNLSEKAFMHTLSHRLSRSVVVLFFSDMVLAEGHFKP